MTQICQGSFSVRKRTRNDKGTVVLNINHRRAQINRHTNNIFV